MACPTPPENELAADNNLHLAYQTQYIDLTPGSAHLPLQCFNRYLQVKSPEEIFPISKGVPGTDLLI